MRQNTTSSLLDPAAYNKTLFPVHIIHKKCTYNVYTAVRRVRKGINLLSYKTV